MCPAWSQYDNYPRHRTDTHLAQNNTWFLVLMLRHRQTWMSQSQWSDGVHEVTAYMYSNVIDGWLRSWKECIHFNPLTPNDHYSGRTAPLTSKYCILYIYSTNIGTDYFKHGIYSPFFSLQNAVCFIIITYLVPVLFTFYIQGVLKLKKIIPAPKG